MSGDPQSERRRTALSDADVAKIGQQLDKCFDTKFRDWCEVIGYDVSTPESRQEIRKDHEFVRGARGAKNYLLLAFFGAVATAAGTAVAAIFGGG